MNTVSGFNHLTEIIMSLTQLANDLTAIFPTVFAYDLTRYVIGAGGVYLIVNLLLAARIAARKIRLKEPPGGQVRREILASLRTVLIFACNGTLIVFGARNGVFTIYSDIADYGWWYLGVSSLILIVAHDAWFYWSHRLLHHPPLFRRFHRLHHRSHNPTPFTAYSFDAGEAIVNAVYLPLILLVLPVHPAALLIFTSHMILRNAVGHCGYELFPANRGGRPLLDWMTTVTHHDLHHAHAGCNLGLYFTWWDRWMGTEHPDYHAEFARVARPLKVRPKTVGAVATILLAGMLDATRAEAATLTGTYASPGIGIVVRFEPCAGAADTSCGRLVWTWEAAGRLKADKGDIIIRGLRWDGKAWSGGKLLNPEDGRTYRGSVKRTGRNTLQLKGCAGPFCRTQTWRSTKSILRDLSGLPTD